MAIPLSSIKPRLATWAALTTLHFTRQSCERCRHFTAEVYRVVSKVARLSLENNELIAAAAAAAVGRLSEAAASPQIISLRKSAVPRIRGLPDGWLNIYSLGRPEEILQVTSFGLDVPPPRR